MPPQLGSREDFGVSWSASGFGGLDWGDLHVYVRRLDREPWYGYVHSVASEGAYDVAVKVVRDDRFGPGGYRAEWQAGGGLFVQYGVPRGHYIYRVGMVVPSDGANSDGASQLRAALNSFRVD